MEHSIYYPNSHNHPKLHPSSLLPTAQSPKQYVHVQLHRLGSRGSVVGEAGKVTGSIPDEITGFFMALGSTPASNRNEYQESSWG
jgi:hypothetical protein